MFLWRAFPWYSFQTAKPSKPEFKTVLDDKFVKYGENVALLCKINEGVTVTWQKDDKELQCVEGKHTVQNTGEECSLTIRNVKDKDEGKYTLTVSNSEGRASCSAMIYVALQNWRELRSRDQGAMISELQELTISNDTVKQLNFLLYGPTGSGKSSIINTIKSIFAGRQCVNCLVGAESSRSCTVEYEKYVIQNARRQCLPFAFFDLMGLEKSINGGIKTEDIVNCLLGHVAEGYTFHPLVPVSESNRYYITNPSLSERIHCLVCVLPADRLSIMEKEYINKMRPIMDKAKELRVLPVALLTKVDCACLLTQQDLKNVYKSKVIKEKLEKCSDILGIPVNCVFPVQNYHSETHMDNEINCLMLDTFTNIVHWANDRVENLTKYD